jgi:hypothetical protein
MAPVLQLRGSSKDGSVLCIGLILYQFHFIYYCPYTYNTRNNVQSLTSSHIYFNSVTTNTRILRNFTFHHDATSLRIPYFFTTMRICLFLIGRIRWTVDSHRQCKHVSRGRGGDRSLCFIPPLKKTLQCIRHT